MQPDPKVFLRGIRSELLQAAGEADAAGNEPRAMAYQRAAEAMIHLAVKQEQIPAAVLDLRPRLHALLKRTTDSMRGFAIPVPESVASELTKSADHSDSEAALRDYEALGFALSECLDALGHHRERPEVAGLADETGLSASELEEDLRSIRAAGADAIREGSARSRPSLDLKPLTDDAVTAYLRDQLPQYPAIRATGVTRQKGFNTKEIFVFELSGHPDWPSQVVLRRNRPVDSVGNLVSDEFELLEWLYRCGYPIPRPLLAGSDSSTIERAFIISERVAGKALPVSSFGSGAVPAALEMAKRLAELHCLDVTAIPNNRQLYQGNTAERTLAMVDRFYQMTKAAHYEPSLTHAAAFAWLRANVNRISSQRVVVHGDYDCRNILFENGHLTAVLDWELAHLGNPAEDLAYCRPQIEEVMDWQQFLNAYQSHGGMVVRDEEIRYFEIYSDVFRIATMYAACNNYCLGRHTDILIGTAGLIEFPVHLSRIAALLRREAARG